MRAYSALLLLLLSRRCLSQVGPILVQFQTPSATPTPSSGRIGAVQTSATSPIQFSLQLRKGNDALDSLSLSDSLPPVTLQVWSNRCWSQIAVMNLSCALTSAAGQPAGASPVVAIQASPLGQTTQGPCTLQLPFSVSLALAFRSPGGSATLSCAVRAMNASNTDASSSSVALSLSLMPTEWPLYDDVITISPPSANGSVLTFSMVSGLTVAGSAIDIAPVLLGICVNTSSTFCTIASAMSSFPYVLQAVTASWSGVALPTPSLATQSSFSLSLGGSALLVLRARAVAFSASSTVNVSGTPCPVVLASPDGRWLILQTPSLQKLQCQGLECGYAALAVSTPGGSSATALVAARRLDSNATAYSYRGAALVCPPFCPGLLLPTSAASNSSALKSVVPIALDASGSLFAPLSRTAALASLATASSTAASSSSSTTMGLYFSQPCSLSSFMGALTGACVNANDPASTQCGLGSGDSCSRCPSGALCPGGTRLWPRPGYYAPSERELGVVACAPPAPQSRCLGWDAAQGVTACGSGYRPASYLCASCADGWFMQDDGSCVTCPAYLGSGAAPWWSAYAGLFTVAAAVITCTLLFFGLLLAHRYSCARQCEFSFVQYLDVIGEYHPLFLFHVRAKPLGRGTHTWPTGVHVTNVPLFLLRHALTSTLWVLLALQLASQVAHPWSPHLPSLLRDGLFPSMGLLVLRGTVVSAACAAPLSGIASTALHPFAFQLGLFSAALLLATIAHVCIIWPDAHRSARYIGATCAIGSLLLIPAVSESSVALLNCVSVRLPPAGRASLDGVAEVTLSTGATSSVLTSATYVASLQTEFLLLANPRYICFSGSHLNVGLMAVAALALCIVSLPIMLCVVLLRDPRLGRFRGMPPPPVLKHHGKSQASAVLQPAGPRAAITRPLPPTDEHFGNISAPATASSTRDTAISVTPLAKKSLAVSAKTDMPPDPVIEAILGPYAPRAWPLAILDPFAAIVLGVLEGFYLHPVDLSGVLIKACVGATVVVVLFVIVIVIRPFAHGHEWKAPVRAAILVLALVCILNNLGAGLVQIGYADGGPWQDVGTGVVYSAASVSAVILAGCWVWHVLCTNAPMQMSSPAATVDASLDVGAVSPSALAVAPATATDLVSPLHAVTAPPVEATSHPPRAAASSDSRRDSASAVRPVLAASPQDALVESIPTSDVRPASQVVPSSRAASPARHAPPSMPGGPDASTVTSVVPAEGGASRGLPPRRGMNLRQLSIQAGAAAPPSSTRAPLERSPAFQAPPVQPNALTSPSSLQPVPPADAATIDSAQSRPPVQAISAAEVSQTVMAAEEPPAANSARGESSRAPSVSAPRGLDAPAPHQLPTPDQQPAHDEQRRSSNDKDAGPVPSARRIPPSLSIPPAASRVAPVPVVGPVAPPSARGAAGQPPEPRAAEDHDPAPARGGVGSVAEESWALGDESSDSQGRRASSGRASRAPGGGGAGGASREPAVVPRNVVPPQLSLGHSRRSRDWLAAVSSRGPAPSSRQPISAFKSSQTAREEERDRHRLDRLLPGEALPASPSHPPTSPLLGSPSRLPRGVPVHDSGGDDATPSIASRQPRGAIAVAPAPHRARSPLTITEQQALLSPTRRGPPPAGGDAATARAALGQQQHAPPSPGGGAATLPAASVPQRPEVQALAAVLPTPRGTASKPVLPFFILPPPERPAAGPADPPPVSSRTSARAAPVWAAAAAALPPGLSLHSRDPSSVGGRASRQPQPQQQQQQQLPTPRPADAGAITTSARTAPWGALQQPREWPGRPVEGIGAAPAATSTLAATARSTLSPPLQLLPTSSSSCSGRKDAVPHAEPPQSARGQAATEGTRWGFGPRGSGGAGGGAPPTSRPSDVPGLLLGAPQQGPSSPRDPVAPAPTPRLAAAVQSPRLLRQLQMQRAAGPPASPQY